MVQTRSTSRAKPSEGEMRKALTAPTKTLTLLRWVGGKTSSLPALRLAVERLGGIGEKQTYFEPFIGGGALYFSLRITPSLGIKPTFNAVLNDSNFYLMAAYKAVRDDLPGLQRMMNNALWGASKENFLRIRAEQPPQSTLASLVPGAALYAAAWMLYLNLHGYNGLWRVNAKGRYNVPYDVSSLDNTLDWTKLDVCAHALQRTTLLSGDFAAAVRTAKAGDLVYFDPPYIPVEAAPTPAPTPAAHPAPAPARTSSGFTGYTPGGFDDDAQLRLSNLAEDLHGRGVRVILSGSATERTRELYKGWKMEPLLVPRRISCKAAGRGKVEELLITPPARSKTKSPKPRAEQSAAQGAARGASNVDKVST